MCNDEFSLLHATVLHPSNADREGCESVNEVKVNFKTGRVSNEYMTVLFGL